jgi:hypothetical protein
MPEQRIHHLHAGGRKIGTHFPIAAGIEEKTLTLPSLPYRITFLENVARPHTMQGGATGEV